MTADDRTLAGGQPWQDFGRQELTVLPQPPLLDPQTARAVRVLCWTLTALLWILIALAAVTATAVLVTFFGGGAPAGP